MGIGPSWETLISDPIFSNFVLLFFFYLFQHDCSINYSRNLTESVVISNYDYGSNKKKVNIISRNSADGVTIMTIRETNDFLVEDVDENCVKR